MNFKKFTLVFLFLFFSNSIANDLFESLAFTTSCTYTSSTGNNYDFNKITQYSDLQINGKRGSYFFSVCHNTYRSCGTLQTPVCISQPEPYVGFSSGGELNSKTFIENENGDIELHYNKGSTCLQSTDQRSTNLILRCNEDAFQPIISKLKEGCEISLLVESIYACPISDKCSNYQSSYDCHKDCDCGWCPSEGGFCKSKNDDRVCYSSMTFGSSCSNNYSPAGSSASSLINNKYFWIGIGLLSLILAIAAFLLFMSFVVGSALLVKKLIRSRKTKAEFTLLEVNDDNDNSDDNSENNKKIPLKEFENQPTAPEFTEVKTNTSLYPQISQQIPQQIPQQPLIQFQQSSDVMFYIPVTNQQFSQLPYEQQQSIINTINQQRSQFSGNGNSFI